jgi:hypothetical protein
VDVILRDWTRQIFLFRFQIFLMKVANSRPVRIINTDVVGEKRQEHDGIVTAVLCY